MKCTSTAQISHHGSTLLTNMYIGLHKKWCLARDNLPSWVQGWHNYGNENQCLMWEEKWNCNITKSLHFGCLCVLGHEKFTEILSNISFMISYYTNYVW